MNTLKYVFVKAEVSSLFLILFYCSALALNLTENKTIQNLCYIHQSNLQILILLIASFGCINLELKKGENVKARWNHHPAKSLQKKWIKLNLSEERRFTPTSHITKWLGEHSIKYSRTTAVERGEEGGGNNRQKLRGLSQRGSNSSGSSVEKEEEKDAATA